MKSDGLEDRHHLEIPEAVVSKKDMAQDVLFMFTDKLVVTFTIEGKVEILHASANLQKTFWRLYKVAQGCTRLHKVVQGCTSLESL